MWGRLRATSANNGYNAILGSTATNAEVLFSGSVSNFTSISTSLGAVLHWVDSNKYYKAYIDGTHLVILKKVNSTITRFASIKFAAKAGTAHDLRFNIVDATLSAKVWQTGTTEPAAWMMMATDNTFSSGSCV